VPDRECRRRSPRAPEPHRWEPPSKHRHTSRSPRGSSPKQRGRLRHACLGARPVDGGRMPSRTAAVSGGRRSLLHASLSLRSGEHPGSAASGDLMTPRARRCGAERRVGARLLQVAPLVSCIRLFYGRCSLRGANGQDVGICYRSKITRLEGDQRLRLA